MFLFSSSKPTELYLHTYLTLINLPPSYKKSLGISGIFLHSWITFIFSLAKNYSLIIPESRSPKLGCWWVYILMERPEEGILPHISQLLSPGNPRDSLVCTCNSHPPLPSSHGILPWGSISHLLPGSLLWRTP